MKNCFRSLPIALALLVVGLLVFGMGIFRLRANEGAALWSSVSGEVIASRSVIRSDAKGSDYIPIIRYRYEVGDQTYEGDRITFSSGFLETTQTGAEEILSQYPLGNSVRVFYDSNRPEKSVLERGKTLGGWLQMGIGLLLLLGGLFCLKLERSSRCSTQ